MGLFGKSKKAEAAPAPPPKPTVLIVDDDMTIAELNAAVFEGRPWNVVTAYDGVSALAAVNTHHPALALLDLMLPDIPGEKVLEAIRSVRAPTKVIVVTGRFVTASEFEPYSGIVVWVLRKPFELNVLRGLIERFERGDLVAPELSRVGEE